MRPTFLGLLFATTLSWLLLADVCQAERIFVSQQDGASDDNAGTRNEPMRTISAAIERAQPGDVVLVSSGDYRDEDSGWGQGVIPVIGKGGQQPIRIRTTFAARVLVKRFLVRDSNNISIERFQFRGINFLEFPNWKDMPNIVVKDPDYEQPDFFLDYSTRKALIEDQFETYFSLVDSLDFSSAIEVENSEQVSVIGNSIIGYWAGIQCRQCKKMTIRSNRIWHTVNGIYTWLPKALVDSKIRLNVIGQSLDNGSDIREQSSKIDVAGNLVVMSGRSHISFMNGVSSSIIRNNVLLFGGYYSETMEFPGSSAISVNSSGEGNRVFRNYISGQIDLTEIDGNGIILDFIQDGHRVWVEKNVAVNNQGSGLNTTNSPNAYIRANSFGENRIGIKLSRDQDVEQTLIRNRLLSNSVAGIQTSLNIEKQTLIDSNFYRTQEGVPLILDGAPEHGTFFFTIEQLREATGWEQLGSAVILDQ